MMRLWAIVAGLAVSLIHGLVWTGVLIGFVTGELYPGATSLLAVVLALSRPSCWPCCRTSRSLKTRDGGC